MLAGVRGRMLGQLSGWTDLLLLFLMGFYGFYGFYVFWKSVSIPDAEVEHQGRALKSHHTTDDNQYLSLCSGI